VERGVFIDIDVNGTAVSIPRSPFRFSRGSAGPRGGAYPQGHDNRSALTALLELGDEELSALEAAGVLIAPAAAKSR
jgi:crotonobetainyl-CoA:carnitine CoA-transferase CaiB-like acyl-CoA transferase